MRHHTVGLAGHLSKPSAWEILDESLNRLPSCATVLARIRVVSTPQTSVDSRFVGTWDLPSTELPHRHLLF